MFFIDEFSVAQNIALPTKFKQAKQAVDDRHYEKRNKNIFIQERRKKLEREYMSLPQSASLTAPSGKEPDKALSDRFDFRPLSLASLDSSPSGRAEKKHLSGKYSSV